MTDFHMPDSWYEPPAEHDCDNPDCDGDQCAEDALDEYEAILADRAEADAEERR